MPGNMGECMKGDTRKNGNFLRSLSWNCCPSPNVCWTRLCCDSMNTIPPAAKYTIPWWHICAICLVKGIDELGVIRFMNKGMGRCSRRRPALRRCQLRTHGSWFRMAGYTLHPLCFFCLYAMSLADLCLTRLKTRGTTSERCLNLWTCGVSGYAGGGMLVPSWARCMQIGIDEGGGIPVLCLKSVLLQL